MHLQQFKGLSSWREDTITVKAKAVGTLDFMDTKPNQFVIQNENHYPVYIGIGSIPSDKKFEFRIGANTNDVFGRPTPTNKIMFYNPSDAPMVIRVFSIYQDFDILTLKNMTANIQNATVETDGMVRGFSQGVKLPSGDNLIGKVELAIDQFQKIENMNTNIENINENCKYVPNISNKLEEINNRMIVGQKEFLDAVYGYTVPTNKVSNFVLKKGQLLSLTVPDASPENNEKYQYILDIKYLEFFNRTNKEISLSLSGSSFEIPPMENMVITDMELYNMIMTYSFGYTPGETPNYDKIIFRFRFTDGTELSDATDNDMIGFRYNIGFYRIPKEV